MIRSRSAKTVRRMSRSSRLPAIRIIPGLTVIRPADGNETSAAWRYASAKQGSGCARIDSQNLPILEGTAEKAREGIDAKAHMYIRSSKRQAASANSRYRLRSSACCCRTESLAEEGIHVRVISMPSWELFEKQSQGISAIPLSCRM